MKFPDIPLGGSELQYFNIEEIIPDHINVMLNSFDRQEKVNIHWQHQYFDQPSVQPLADKRVTDWIDQIVFVSYHQKDLYERYLKVPLEKSVVIRNAIWPLKYTPRKKDKIRLIYTSTPFRGLNILLGAFEILCKKKKYDLHLDVFSSMKLYGKNYMNQEPMFENLYDFCRDHDRITYHGVVSNFELRPFLEKADIFAYPNTWPETSCCSLIEAMSAGCYPIMTNIGGLPETNPFFGTMYSPVSIDGYNDHMAKDHIYQYADVLEHGIQQYLNSDVQDMVEFTNKYYSWNVRLEEWKNFFNFWR